MMAKGRGRSFKDRHFTSEVILWALRWYLAFPISYRDLAVMLADRGIVVDHTTLFRWVQAYAATLERRIRKHLQPCTGSWRVDETYIKVRGVWTYLYRAVDSLGQTIDFPSFGSAGRSSGQALLPQNPAAAAHDERAEVEGYAAAACLTRQEQPFLREQGHLWATGILERGGSLNHWRILGDAVTAGAARLPMPVARGDGPVHASSKPMRLLFCHELVRSPAVRAAVGRQLRRLLPARVP